MNVQPLHHSQNGYVNGKASKGEFDLPGNVTFALPGIHGHDRDEVRVVFRHEFVHTDRNRQIETIARTSLIAFGLLMGVVVTYMVKFHF